MKTVEKIEDNGGKECMSIGEALKQLNQLVQEKSGKVKKNVGGKRTAKTDLSSKCNTLNSSPDVSKNEGNNVAALSSNDNNDATANPLSEIIPGYTAPMKLTSNLEGTSKDFDKCARDHAKADASRVDSYAKALLSGNKKVVDVNTSTGLDGWFGMRGVEMTDELKADMNVIKMRNYLDRSRFYKSSDKFHSVVQVGTVIESSKEYYSSRLKKKDRRKNFTEEMMADYKNVQFTKRKFNELNAKSNNFVKYETKRGRGSSKRRKRR